MSGPRSRREQLGAELEHLRRLAGRSGRALAGVLSISQSTISRVESGKALLSRDEVDAWADATAADAATRDRLLALVDAALGRRRPGAASSVRAGHTCRTRYAAGKPERGSCATSNPRWCRAVADP